MKGLAVGRPLCGGKKKSGGTCKWIAGRRTGHPGEGKCWLHGGATPIKHGRYSKVSHPRVAELLTAQEADPDPLNILPDLHITRALGIDYINRHEVVTNALLDWHLKRWLDPEEQEAMYGVIDELEALWREGVPTPEMLRRLKLARAAVKHLGEIPGDRPDSVPDLASVYRIVSEATKMVERIEKIRAANAISRPDLNRLMNEMGRVVATFVDPGQAQKIKEGWLELRV